MGEKNRIVFTDLTMEEWVACANADVPGDMERNGWGWEGSPKEIAIFKTFKIAAQCLCSELIKRRSVTWCNKILGKCQEAVQRAVEKSSFECSDSSDLSTDISESLDRFKPRIKHQNVWEKKPGV